MTNVLVDVWFTVDVPEDRVLKLVGRPDDDSQEWYEAAGIAAGEWVRDNMMDALDLAEPPDIEVDGEVISG
jgi:hypothetical protein